MTENNPTEKQTALFPELADTLKEYDRQEFYTKTLNKWQEALKKADSDEIATELTYKQIEDAFLNGTKITVNIITGHTKHVLSKDYNYGKGDHKYLTNDTPGERSIIVEVKETTRELELFISGVDASRKLGYNDKKEQVAAPDPLNWTATCFQTYYHEYNYNAGSESGKSKYIIKCVDGTLSWEYVGNERN